MSEYCYQCRDCGEFKEFCKCPKGFNDPMEEFRDMSMSELLEDLNEPNLRGANK